ncbi:MAG: GAF domain-containing protein, partial [Phycisphaerales bacterium]|nr:GAF domain-containing protein [Phycisphaerales bacterium]
MSASPKVITTNEQAEQAWSHGGDHAPADLLSRCASIARHKTAPRDRAEALLDAIMESLGCLAGSMTVGVGSDEIEARRARDTEGVDAWVRTLDDAAMDSRSHAALIARLFGPDPSSPEFALISAPIESPGRDPIGGLSLLCRCTSVAQAERVQLYLRAACMQASSMFVKAAARRSGVEMNDIARVYNRAGQYRTLDEFAFTIANAVRQRFNCDQAAIGIVRDGRISVRSISGLDHVRKRSPGVHRLEQAMGECVDAGRPVVAQRRDEWQELDFADEGMLHQRWSAAAANASVVSLPMIVGDDIVAVVSLRREGDQPFDAADVEAAERLLAPLAGAIPLVRRSTRTVPAHVMQSARDKARWMVAPGSLRRKAVVLLGLAALGWGAMGRSMHRVVVPASIVSTREHVVAAPIDAVVEEVLVRSGAEVRKGDPLVRMDTRMLALERREVDAEVDRQQLRLNEGIASGEPAMAAVARLELQSLMTRRERLDE